MASATSTARMARAVERARGVLADRFARPLHVVERRAGERIDAQRSRRPAARNRSRAGCARAATLRDRSRRGFALPCGRRSRTSSVQRSPARSAGTSRVVAPSMLARARTARSGAAPAPPASPPLDAQRKAVARGPTRAADRRRRRRPRCPRLPTRPAARRRGAGRHARRVAEARRALAATSSSAARAARRPLANHAAGPARKARAAPMRGREAAVASATTRCPRRKR